jgi:transcriptional regulator NrdR family protein
MSCEHRLNKVVDSRRKDDFTLRRRECIKCAHRWSTIEIDVPVHGNSEGHIEAIKRHWTSEMLVEIGFAMRTNKK